jgi:hypothetical protein
MGLKNEQMETGEDPIKFSQMTIRQLREKMISRNSVLLAILILMSSCSSYYISADSLRTQFSGLDSTALKAVTVRGPMGERYNYLANPIDTIYCVDKSGDPHSLTNSPSVEMRVTDKMGRRAIFYFDRVFVTDSTLSGVQSRFISSINKTIKLKDIRKIEIQDGKKNFYYVSK